MTSLLETVAAVAAWLEREHVPYMVIGGIANSVWGVPRATLDVDVTVWVPDAGLPAFVAALPAGFTSRVAEPLAFAMGSRVLPLLAPAGTPVDLVFGLLPFEEEAIRRARTVDLAYLEPRVEELSALLDVPEIRDRWIEWKRAATTR